jgi:hypothetical protein
MTIVEKVYFVVNLRVITGYIVLRIIHANVLFCFHWSHDVDLQLSQIMLFSKISNFVGHKSEQ